MAEDEDRTEEARGLLEQIDCAGECPGLEILRLRDRVAVLEAFGNTVNVIRNSIVGLQTINWSEHIYPLVAALNESGFEADSYDVACKEHGTMLERTVKAEARNEELEAHVLELEAPHVWHLPQSVPLDGTHVRIWIDECDGFEHPGTFTGARAHGGIRTFRDTVHGDYTAGTLWRHATKVAPPSPKLVQASHDEFKRLDNADGE